MYRFFYYIQFDTRAHNAEMAIVPFIFFSLIFASLSEMRNAQAYAIYEQPHEVFRFQTFIRIVSHVCTLFSYLLYCRYHRESWAIAKIRAKIMNPNFSFHLPGIVPPPPPIPHHAMQNPTIPPAPAVSPSQSVPGRRTPLGTVGIGGFYAQSTMSPPLVQHQTDENLPSGSRER